MVNISRYIDILKGNAKNVPTLTKLLVFFPYNKGKNYRYMYKTNK